MQIRDGGMGMEGEATTKVQAQPQPLRRKKKSLKPASLESSGGWCRVWQQRESQYGVQVPLIPIKNPGAFLQLSSSTRARDSPLLPDMASCRYR